MKCLILQWGIHSNSQQPPHSARRWTGISATVSEIASSSRTQFIHVISTTIPHKDPLTILTAAWDIVTETDEHWHAAIIFMRMRTEQPSGILCITLAGAWARIGHLDPSGAWESVPAFRQVVVALAQQSPTFDVSVAFREKAIVLAFIGYCSNVVTWLIQIGNHESEMCLVVFKVPITIFFIFPSES